MKKPRQNRKRPHVLHTAVATQRAKRRLMVPKNHLFYKRNVYLSKLINSRYKQALYEPLSLPKIGSSNYLITGKRLEFNTTVRGSQAITYSESNLEFTQDRVCIKKSFLFHVSNHSNTHSLLTSSCQKPVTWTQKFYEIQLSGPSCDIPMCTHTKKMYVSSHPHHSDLSPVSLFLNYKLSEYRREISVQLSRSVGTRPAKDSKRGYQNSKTVVRTRTMRSETWITYRGQESSQSTIGNKTQDQESFLTCSQQIYQYSNIAVIRAY